MLYKVAISQAIVEAMERDPKVVLLGQNVATKHGVFGTTTEAARRFPERVIECPISETMLTGACVGLAMEGWKPIFVHTRADFGLFSFEHLINTAAKLPFLHGKPIPFVMRCVVGRGWGQGPVHSQSWHHLLAQVPGLDVVVPFSGASYQRWMERALGANHPTILFEPRRLYDRTEWDLFIADYEPTSKTLPIVCVGDTVLEGITARDRLIDMGEDCIVYAWEDMGRFPDVPARHVLVDSAPHRSQPGVIAPPFEPLGVSRPYERAWYPTADDIVEEVCRILGREAPPREERHEPVAAGPF